MSVDWIGFDNFVGLAFELPLAGYLIAILYGGGVLWLLIRHRWDFVRLDRKHLIALGVFTVVTPLAAEVITLYFPGEVVLRPLLYLPLVFVGVGIGVGPATALGVLTGLTLMLFDTARLTQPMEIGLTAGIMAVVLNQRYWGQIGNWLRRPIISTPLVILIVGWPITLLAMLLTHPASGLTALSYVSAQALSTGLAQIGSGLVAAGVLHLMLWRWPSWQLAKPEVLVAPPWERHLSHRLLFTFIPLAFTGIIILVSAVAFIAHRVATDLVIDQMTQDATTAGDGIPFFIQVGRSLILNLAKDEALLTGSSEERQRYLEEGLRAVPFFQQLIFFDEMGTPISSYPDVATMGLGLSTEERTRVRFALEGGIPTEITVITHGDDRAVFVSFVAPVGDTTVMGEPCGVIMGRAPLSANPILTLVENALGSALVPAREGFIIDEAGQILLYPNHPERQLETFNLDTAEEIGRGQGLGRAFRERQSDGTVQIVYLLPVEGHSEWAIVIIVPNDVVLEQAVHISLPILIILVMMTFAAFPLTIAITTRITVPLETLAEAAGRIAKGQLDRPIYVGGQDEVGRLGLAFEGMRQRLKGRLSEQEKLLSVSRSVSASLELFRSMPPILSAALEATDAAGVRIVLRTEGAEVQTYAAGAVAAGMASLDQQLLDLVEQEGTVVIGQLWRASGALETSSASSDIKALVALPLRSDTSFHGVLWLGYDHEHAFEESELTFISTLGGQAAVAVSNARLFAAAEGGRRRLVTILASTADAVIVTDNDGRIVLMNPAAEEIFGIRSEAARNRPILRVVDQPELVRLLTDLRNPTATLELPERDGKTLYASASTIVGGDGKITGRVAVLRDITYLKELDHMRTVFLHTVAHNIRSPLTYMRGFVNMIPLVGDVNQKQHEALDRILTGIEQINRLTTRLLDLARLESGAELDLTLVDVRAMLESICAALADAADGSQIALSVSASTNIPLLEADETLYREAVFNLVDNALKYTPEGGTVDVCVYSDGQTLTIAVEDNGIGIDPEDQRQLFRAFFRAQQREDDPPKPRGSGLGLALSRAIAEAHNGSVRVESERGKGSTFYITLPLRQPEQEG